MLRTTEVMNGDGGSVKVGMTGTIGSLMIQELESMKRPPQASSHRRRQQTSPVSVPCGASPRKSIHRRSPPNECGNSSSSSSSRGRSCSQNGSGDAYRPRHTTRRNGPQHAMLESEDSPIDRNLNTDKIEKNSYTHIVEVVDVRCGNPMSSRLRKLGFSKLSESIA